MITIITQFLVISYDLQNDLDIQRCKRDFSRQANGILSRFGIGTPEVLTQLLHSYCMSVYGCALWNLNNRSIKALDVCINKVLRHIWSLPYNCHTDILHLVAGSDSIFNICYNRFCKLLFLIYATIVFVSYCVQLRSLVNLSSMICFSRLLTVLSQFYWLLVITLSMALILFVTTVMQIFQLLI